MKSNELSLNRLTEGQSVPRPQFGDASIVFDSDGVFKYIDGDDGAMKLIYPITNILFLYPEATLMVSGTSITVVNSTVVGSIANFSIVGPYLSSYYGSGLSTITTFIGVEKLTQVRNRGTLNAIDLSNMNLSAAIIDKFFTDLPTTTKTATINVSSNPGSATCTPSIATAKGYIVNQ
jgi:hypothetical protein